MFRRAKRQFSKLNALDASTSKAPSDSAQRHQISVSYHEQQPHSHHAGWHIGDSHAEVFRMSCLSVVRMTLAIKCLEVSPIPIGLTAGFLLRAIGQLYRRG